MKIKDLSVEERIKNALREMVTPKKTAQIAVIIDRGYNTTNKEIQIWEAKGWIKRLKKGRTVLYYIDGDLLQVD
jgi:transposase